MLPYMYRTIPGGGTVSFFFLEWWHDLVLVHGQEGIIAGRGHKEVVARSGHVQFSRDLAKTLARRADVATAKRRGRGRNVPNAEIGIEGRTTLSRTSSFCKQDRNRSQKSNSVIIKESAMIL